MSGSTVFLLSFGATALLGVLLVGPGIEEALILEEEILAAEIDGDTGSAESRVETAAADLALAMGLQASENGGGWDPREVLAGLSTVEDVVRAGERGVSFTIDWNRLPALLARLADGKAPPLENLEAVATGEPPRCGVTLLFAPLPSGFTPR